MSRTDKDQPDWVRNHDNGVIDHDHRHGECRVETLEQLRERNVSRRTRRHRRCRKFVPHTWRCGEDLGYYRHDCPSRRASFAWDERLERYRYFDGPPPPCPGHEGTRYDPDVPCSCDAVPEPPPCTVAWTVRTRYYTTSTPPPGWERETLYGPQRVAVRDVLGELAKEWNATGEVDEDAVARHGVDIYGRLPYWD